MKKSQIQQGPEQEEIKVKYFQIRRNERGEVFSYHNAPKVYRPAFTKGRVVDDYLIHPFGYRPPNVDDCPNCKHPYKTKYHMISCLNRL